MRLELHRVAYLPQATLGWLNVPGIAPLATIERPWVPSREFAGGALSISCIPDGVYDLTPYESPTHGDTWVLTNPGLGVHFLDRPVPNQGRTMIQIHVANRASELEGCIAVGKFFAGISVEQSAVAMNALRRALLDVDDISILIRPTTGTLEG